MARKKAPGAPHVTVVTAGPTQEPDERPANEQADDAVIDQASSELPTQAKARLYRSHPATGNREAFVDSIDASMFSQDYVRDNYGGGRYRVQFFGPRDGKVAYIKQTQFDVDLTIPPKVPGIGTAAAPASAPSAPQHGSSALDMAIVSMLTTMMSNMSAQQQQQAEATRAMTAMQMQMMKDHSTMLSAQLAQLGQKPEGRDPFDMMKEVVGLIKPEPGRSLREELETLQMLRELTGDKDSETSWLDVVKELAPPLLAGAAQRDRRVAPKRAGVPGVPISGPISGPGLPGPTTPEPGGSEAATASPEPPNVEVMPSLKFVAPIIPKLVKWAGQGRPPALCAEWQLSEIPEGFYPMLREQLSAPTLLDDLGQAFPATISVRAWVEEFRLAMLELMEPESEHGDDDPDADPDEMGDDEPE